MIENLKKIAFHDSVPIDLSLNFDSNSFKLIIEESESLNLIELNFKDVSNLTIGNLFEYDDFEINNVDFIIQKDSYFIKFTFLLGISKPSWEISFNFKTLTIN